MKNQTELTISEGHINAYVALSVEAMQEISDRDDVAACVVVDDNMLWAIQKSPLRKVVFLLDDSVAHHHQQLSMEVSYDCHCVPQSELLDMKVQDGPQGKIFAGQFANGFGTLKDGDEIGISYKKFISPSSPKNKVGVHSINEVFIGHTKPEHSFDSTLNLHEFLEECRDVLEIACNASDAYDIDAISAEAVRTIGLFRTENAFTNTTKEKDLLKSLYISVEGEARDDLLRQFQDFSHRQFSDLMKNLTEKMPGSIVNVRLLDEGPEQLFRGDKISDFMNVHGRVKRGADLAFSIPGLYETQLTALFTAMQDFPAQDVSFNIVLPNVVSTEHVMHFKSVIEDLQAGFSFEKPVGFAIMMETPEAFAQAEALAEICDDFKFGTNDFSASLLNYKRVLRNNADIAPLKKYKEEFGFDPRDCLAPEVKDAIAATIDAIRAVNPQAKIALCGDQVSQPEGVVDAISFALEKRIDMVSVRARRPKIMAAAMVIKEMTENFDTAPDHENAPPEPAGMS